MIEYPSNWEKAGQPIAIEDVEKAIIDVLRDIDCDCLSFSGGVDSTLLAHLMIQSGKKPKTFTMGSSVHHPDIVHARAAIRHLGIGEHHIYMPTADEISDEKRAGEFFGDEGIRLFYKHIKSKGVEAIIAGDGIDEFMCGYYAHQDACDYATYYDFLRRMQHEQIQPLNRNSGEVKVYLPYLDDRVSSLLTQIPLEEKVDKDLRKKVMVQMALRAGIPEDIIYRWKYGFCNALQIKGKAQVREAVA